MCHERAERLKVSSFAFNFKGGVAGLSGVNGNSGSHDLDYPTLDKAVGRSSEKRWEHYNQRKIDRDKVRKESGTNTISYDQNGKPVPTDKKLLQVREKALKIVSDLKKSNEL